MLQKPIRSLRLVGPSLEPLPHGDVEQTVPFITDRAVHGKVDWEFLGHPVSQAQADCRPGIIKRVEPAIDTGHAAKSHNAEPLTQPFAILDLCRNKGLVDAGVSRRVRRIYKTLYMS
ncbi:hypothetical protein [Roseovarius sp. MBR-51]